MELLRSASLLKLMLSQKLACVSQVPVGSIVRRKEAEGGEPALAELLQPGQRALLIPGGRGGRGNASFKSGRNK